MKTHKILTSSALALVAQLGVANAGVFVIENFNALDPTTDTTGSGALGGQGQLEDITGTTWSGANSNSAPLQTRVSDAVAGDRNVRILASGGANDLLITSKTFSAQTQADEFSFFFNLESWGTDNAGAGNANSGRLELGVRNSTSGDTIFGYEMLTGFNKNDQFRSFVYDYTGSGRTEINDSQNGTGGTLVLGSTVGSLGFSYDGAGGMTLNVYSGANLTGTLLQTETGPTLGNNFSADSIYIRQSATAAIRAIDVQVDDLSIVAVPEPSTSVFLGLGGLALILRRRK